MNYDLIFECDYGNRTPIKELLKELLTTYDADTLPLAGIFVDNTPYTLSLFVVLNFIADNESLRIKVTEAFKSTGSRLRTDITFGDLLESLKDRKFNFKTFIDAEQCEATFKEGMFFFAEKKDLIEKLYVVGDIKPENLVFVSYSSANSSDIDNFIHILNRRGIAVWYDKHCVDYGESLVDRIQQGIAESIAVIFWVSKDFLLSNWCKTEMESFLNKYASKRDILIITIKCEDVFHNELPLFLQNIKYLSKEKFKNYEEIVMEVTPAIVGFLRKRGKQI
jgi:hypothetical protein